jgi:hypothetical protein
MVEISLSGSGEGLGWATSRGYSTTDFKPNPRPNSGQGDTGPIATLQGTGAVRALRRLQPPAALRTRCHIVQGRGTCAETGRSAFNLDEPVATAAPATPCPACL